MELKQTTCGLVFKGPAEGRVLAKFAELGVKDLDGDVLLPGSIGEQAVRISAYGHASWSGSLPTGVGKTSEAGPDAIADLHFFMNTTHGHDHFETIRGLGKLGEWSMGFDVLEEGSPTKAERARGVRRVLKKLKIHEVSPVLRGAGIRTGTISAKCNGCGAAVATVGRADLERARATLLAAERVLWGCDPENAEAQKQARFSAYAGHMLTGLPGRIREPEIRWFDPGTVPGTRGWMRPAEHITHLAADLAGEALVATVLHESAHHGQSDPSSPDAEPAADAFAAKWTRPVLSAYRWTDGQAHRLGTTRDRSPPFLGRHLHGDVVLQHGSGRAWALNRRAVTGPWIAIG